MNTSFTSLSYRIQESLPDVTTRGAVLAAAVGIALSQSASLPSSPVEDPTNFYNMQVLANVKDSIGNINENVILDCKDALNWARNMWLVRYYAAHPQFQPFFDVTTSFFEGYFNINSLISIDGRTLLNANNSVVNDLILEVQGALRAEVSRNTAPATVAGF